MTSQSVLCNDAGEEQDDIQYIQQYYRIHKPLELPIAQIKYQFCCRRVISTTRKLLV